MISIEGLDKAEVLFALYTHSSVRGLGWLKARNQVTLDTCRELIDPWSFKETCLESLKECIGDKLVALKDKVLLKRLLEVETDDALLEVWQSCIIKHPPNLYFDYLYGRPIKVDLSEGYFDEMFYDRDNGVEAAARAVISIKETYKIVSKRPGKQYT